MFNQSKDIYESVRLETSQSSSPENRLNYNLSLLNVQLDERMKMFSIQRDWENLKISVNKR